MTRKILLIAGLMLIALGSNRAQGIVDGYPFDTPAEPRSVGMGESFVALPSNPSALMYNPAGLAGLQGFTLSYSRRALNVVPVVDDMMCYSLTGTVAVPFGVFGVQYNRKLIGTLLVTSAANPDGPGTELTYYSYNVAVGFGTRLATGLAVGAAAKYYAGVANPEAAYLFDLGLIYTLPSLHNQDAINDSLTIGVSVQNMYAQKEFKIGSYVVESFVPEYFRMGIAYALRFPPRDESALTPVAVVVSGEYRNLLNYHALPYKGRSYWGVGIEATAFDILSLRAGASFVPFTGFDGERDRPAYRYGAGLNVPFRMIGTGIPLQISINYSVEPLNQVVNPRLAGYSQRASLPAFSLDIHYLATPW